MASSARPSWPPQPPCSYDHTGIIIWAWFEILSSPGRLNTVDASAPLCARPAGRPAWARWRRRLAFRWRRSARSRRAGFPRRRSSPSSPWPGFWGCRWMRTSRLTRVPMASDRGLPRRTWPLSKTTAAEAIERRLPPVSCPIFNCVVSSMTLAGTGSAASKGQARRLGPPASAAESVTEGGAGRLPHLSAKASRPAGVCDHCSTVWAIRRRDRLRNPRLAQNVAVSASVARNLIIPKRILVLAVPSGTPSSTLISRAVWP